MLARGDAPPKEQLPGGIGWAGELALEPHHPATVLLRDGRLVESEPGDGTRVMVEIADTPEKRARGLMFRERLAPNEGMIFLFEEVGLNPLWMKNTLIPLDMLWLDPDGRVVSIAESVPRCRADPCPSYVPDAEAFYVVEVNAGFVRRHGVRVGDILELRNLPERPASQR